MAQVVQRAEDHPGNPYHLHPNENPSLMLVSSPLDGSNYYSWFRAMKMALLSKNKHKFVDGSLPAQDHNDPLYSTWERCNTMVLSWLIHSLSPSIAQSVIWFENATEVWQDLRDRFSQGDSFKIAELQEEIYAFHQGTLSVTEYFTSLKILWEELMNLRPIPSCSCNTKCVCSAIPTIRAYQQSDYVIRFLRGLNDKFATVRSQIMLMEPLPSINKVFALVIQHERQFSEGFKPHSSEHAAFFGRGSKATQPSSKSRPQCSYCGLYGHTVDKCFKKHGYPPGFKPKKRPVINQVEYMGQSTPKESCSVGFNSACLDQQHKTDQPGFLPPISQPDNSPSINTLFANFSSPYNMAGPSQPEDD